MDYVTMEMEKNLLQNDILSSTISGTRITGGLLFFLFIVTVVAIIFHSSRREKIEKEVEDTEVEETIRLDDMNDSDFTTVSLEDPFEDIPVPGILMLHFKEDKYIVKDEEVAIDADIEDPVEDIPVPVLLRLHLKEDRNGVNDEEVAIDVDIDDKGIIEDKEVAMDADINDKYDVDHAQVLKSRYSF